MFNGGFCVRMIKLTPAHTFWRRGAKVSAKQGTCKAPLASLVTIAENMRIVCEPVMRPIDSINLDSV
jgi:hypothetical protein